MVHSFIWYQFDIHPRLSTVVENVISPQKYDIFMMCLQHLGKMYEIDYLLRL